MSNRNGFNERLSSKIEIEFPDFTKLPERVNEKFEGLSISEAERIEEKIDRDLADSFPASDPPGWTMGITKRRSNKDQT